MNKLLENDFAKVLYEEDLYLIMVIWKNRNLTLKDYAYPFEVALDYQKNNRVDNFLSDIRNQKVVSPVFRKWFQNEAVPGAVKQGLKHAAVIFNGNVFKKYYLNNIMNTTKKFGLPLKFFNEIEEAKSWFKSFA